MVLVSGFAVHLVLAPAHPCGSLASQLCPRGLPVRPPREGSLSTARRHAALRRRLAGVVFELVFGGY